MNSHWIVSWARLHVGASILVLLALLADREAAGQGDSTLEDVLRKWREREVAAKTVYVEIAEEYLTGKESWEVGPPEDTVKAMRCVVILDGIKMSYRRAGESWNDSIKAYAHHDTLSVFDGQVLKTLRDTERRDDVLHPEGWITSRKGHSDALSIYLSAVLRHFRPLSATFGLTNETKVRLVSANEVVDGLQCMVVEEPRSVGIWRYWVAREQDMSIVRFVSLVKGNVSLQCDVSFVRDDTIWVPKRWKAIRLANTKVLDSASATVTKIEVNRPLSPFAFDVTFPPGTEIHDRVSNKRVVVHPNNAKRDVLESEIERGATYSDLMRTSTGSAGMSSTSSMRGYRILAVLSVCLIIGGLLIVIVRRRFRYSS